MLKGHHRKVCKRDKGGKGEIGSGEGVVMMRRVEPDGLTSDNQKRQKSWNGEKIQKKGEKWGEGVRLIKKGGRAH